MTEYAGPDDWLLSYKPVRRTLLEVHYQLSLGLLGRTPEYVVGAVCCYYCCRVFRSEMHLDSHLRSSSLPLWYRALWKRRNEQRKLGRQTSSEPKRRKQG